MAATTSTTTTTSPTGEVTKIVNEWESTLESKLHVWLGHAESVARIVGYGGAADAAFALAKHLGM